MRSLISDSRLSIAAAIAVAYCLLPFAFAEGASAHERKKKPPAPVAVSLDPDDWNIRFSYLMPPHPVESDIGAWEFDFPLYPDASVHYVTTRYAGPMSGKSIHMTVEMRYTSGTPKFNWTEGGFSPNPCDTPAHARPYFETRRFSGEFDRWWPRQTAVKLQEGLYSIVVPLTPDRWSSVFGKLGTVAPTQFANAMSKVHAVGMTFGGGCFYGHGVNVMNGTVDFILRDYGVR